MTFYVELNERGFAAELRGLLHNVAVLHYVCNEEEEGEQDIFFLLLCSLSPCGFFFSANVHSVLHQYSVLKVDIETSNQIQPQIWDDMQQQTILCFPESFYQTAAAYTTKQSLKLPLLIVDTTRLVSTISCTTTKRSSSKAFINIKQ